MKGSKVATETLTKFTPVTETPEVKVEAPEPKAPPKAKEPAPELWQLVLSNGRVIPLAPDEQMGIMKWYRGVIPTGYRPLKSGALLKMSAVDLIERVPKKRR